MTGDPRWPRDSEQEDAEVHRAAELDKLERWIREEKTRPLTDALAGHGVLPGGGELLRASFILPGWWDEVPEPGGQCWACQRPGVPSPCGQCRAAREQSSDPAEAVAWSWWTGLAAGDRRLLLAARWRRDPWTGRPVRIETDWAEADSSDGNVTTGRHPFHPVTPSTAWDLLRRGGLRWAPWPPPRWQPIPSSPRAGPAAWQVPRR